jgi:glutamate/tyrosine decarboxylase-like PLP-dependent enzyme
LEKDLRNLKVDFIEIDVDENYRIDLNQLEDVLKNNTVMFVMANFGNNRRWCR